MSKPLGLLVIEDAIKGFQQQRGSWVQGSLAENRRGQTENVSSAHAVKWCIDGKLMQSAQKFGGDPALEMARNILYDFGNLGREPKNIHFLNDNKFKSKVDVVKFLEGARQKAMAAV